MDSQNYYSHLEGLRGDDKRIDAEKVRLDNAIQSIATRIKSVLSAENVGSLIWALGIKERDRVAQLVGIPISDFAGHAQHLRAVAASIDFASGIPSEDPHIEELLKECENLWRVMFFRELIDDLKLKYMPSTSEGLRQQRTVAGLMSLLNVIQRETRYVEQADRRVRSIYGPFSDEAIEPALGIDVETVLRGFDAVRTLIDNRFEDVREKYEPIVKKHEAFKALAGTSVSDDELDDFVLNDPAYDYMGRSFREATESLNRIFVVAPSDLRDSLNDKAKVFLDAFSFQPGQVNQTYATPFNQDAVRCRPFAKIRDGRFLLIDALYCSFAPGYRFAECFSAPELQQRLLRRRDVALELDTGELLSPVIKSEITLTNYYIELREPKKFAERDWLFFRDGTLFLVECKAKSLEKALQRRDDLQRFVHTVKDSIQKGYQQACDVYHAVLEGGSGVVFWDSDKASRRALAAISAEMVREVFVIVTLDSSYGLIATDVTPWLQIDDKVGLPWVIDRDTLESVLIEFNEFSRFRDYLRWRQRVHGIAWNEDEAVFAGCFAQHGDVTIPAGAEFVQLNANYSDVLEYAYFQSRGIDVPRPEGQKTPVWSSMQRSGDKLTFAIDGKVVDEVDWRSGRSLPRKTKSKRKRDSSRIGRNDQCPCGSQKKYKNCCLRD